MTTIFLFLPIACENRDKSRGQGADNQQVINQIRNSERGEINIQLVARPEFSSQNSVSQQTQKPARQRSHCQNNRRRSYGFRLGIEEFFNHKNSNFDMNKFVSR
jgi:hypothetical protein